MSGTSIPNPQARCTLCRRELSAPRFVEGLGALGSECIQKVRGLEQWLGNVQGMKGLAGDLTRWRYQLERLGFSVRLRETGAHVLGSSVYELQVVGFRRAPTKEVAQTFQQRRDAFAADLKEAAEARRAAA